jgi:hypothetical protein
MKINKKYKYWELFYDEDNKDNGTYNELDETDRQNISSIWSYEWYGVRDVYNASNDIIKCMLEDDLKCYNKYKFANYETLIDCAIKELQKIKEELPLN